MNGIKDKVEEAKKLIDFNKYRYSIVLETSMGDIRLALFPDVAPNHCKNIIALSNVGFYDGLKFHRVIKGFMIQGGCPQGSGMGGPGYNVSAEFNPTAHEPGVLSMARSQDPDSAGSQFFLCLEKVPYLDNQYTAFGKTEDEIGLGVVRKIGEVKTGAQDKPVEDVTINKARAEAVAL